MLKKADIGFFRKRDPKIQIHKQNGMKSAFFCFENIWRILKPFKLSRHFAKSGYILIWTSSPVDLFKSGHSLWSGKYFHFEASTLIVSLSRGLTAWQAWCHAVHFKICPCHAVRCHALQTRNKEKSRGLTVNFTLVTRFVSDLCLVTRYACHALLRELEDTMLI